MSSKDEPRIEAYKPSNRICPECFKRYNVPGKPDTVEMLIIPCKECSSKKVNTWG